VSAQGTTLSVVDALEEQESTGGRAWRVVGFEAMPAAAQKAREVWADYPNVEVVQELVLTEDDLENYVIPFIEGPEQAAWPGRGFYRNFYGATSAQLASGTLGGWLKTKPCEPDLVLIDSTRFAHLGILATLFHSANVGVDNSTVFIVENDFWEDRGRKRDTRDILNENMILDILVDRSVTGERWPWFVARATFPAPAPGVMHTRAAERRRQRLDRTAKQHGAGGGDMWGDSYKKGQAGTNPVG
jgi:hypothetical protein